MASQNLRLCLARPQMDLPRRIGLGRQPAHPGDALVGPEEGEEI